MISIVLIYTFITFSIMLFSTGKKPAPPVPHVEPRVEQVKPRVTFIEAQSRIQKRDVSSEFQEIVDERKKELRQKEIKMWLENNKVLFGN